MANVINEHCLEVLRSQAELSPVSSKIKKTSRLNPAS